MNHKTKIQTLLKTNTDANIKLAFQLAKAEDIELNDEEFQELYDWCVEHKLLKRRKRLQTQYQYVLKLEDVRIVNAVNKLPRGLHWLVNAKTFYFHKCAIQEIPDISSLPFLWEFIIHVGMPGNLNINLLPQSLVKLSVGFCELTEFPKAIGRLSNLRKLNLEHNRLTSLSPDFNQLTELTDVNLNYNRLQTLTEDLTGLSQLKKIHLYDNQLKTLPESIGSLESLEELNIGKNPLESLPESLFDLPKLKWVSLDRENTIPWQQLLKLDERVEKVLMV